MQLAAKYTADRAVIGADVIAMLQDLADKGFLTEARETIARENTHEPDLDRCQPVATAPADGVATLESRGSVAEQFGIPLAVLAELTHRCPLQCPYCSNPLELERAGEELSTDEWKKVLSELAAIGVLQIHFSGGEPTARKDLVELVRHASEVGLYSNLITSAVLLTRDKLAALADAGLSAMCRSAFRASRPVERRSHRRLQGPRQEARSGALDPRAGPAAHRQRGDASAEPASIGRHHPDGGRSRRRPARSRQCAVLRLGAEEPRRADADAAAARRHARAWSKTRASG